SQRIRTMMTIRLAVAFAAIGIAATCLAAPPSEKPAPAAKNREKAEKPTDQGSQKPAPKYITETLRGKVVWLAEALSRKHGLRLGGFGIRQPIMPGSMSGRTDRGIARDQFALHGIDDTPVNWQRLIDAYVRNLPRYLLERPGTVLPGIGDVLALLAGMQVSLGL